MACAVIVMSSCALDHTDLAGCSALARYLVKLAQLDRDVVDAPEEQ